MVEIEKDADTGEEIIFFYRRGKPYLYLRISRVRWVYRRGRWYRLRPFIKRLTTVEKRHFMVVDYSKEEAKKQNPLYIDSGVYTQLKPEEWENRDKINERMVKQLEDIIKRDFGKAVVDKLLEDAGTEFGSIPYYTSRAEENRATTLVVWKHHPEETAKKKEEEVLI